MSIFFYIFVDETENLLVMKKFFVGLMLLCGALALHADDVIYYFHQTHPGISGWWRSDNCQPAIYATSADGETENAPWPGVEMSYSERDGDNDLWHLSIDTTIYKKITFVRVYYSAGICTDQNSKTQEFTVSNLNGRNFFSLTSETQMEIVEGEWFYYGNAYSLPGQPMYYLLGDAAALGAWSTESALPMEGDSIVLNLDPGTYNFKVLTGQSWDNPSYGYSAVNSNCTDVAVQEGSDGNIQITLGSGSEIVVKNVGAGTSSGVICITGNQGTPDGGNLGATTVYCYVTQEWWTDQGATVGMYAYDDSDNVNAAFPGVRMTQSDQVPGLWSAEINPDLYNHLIFTRMNPNDDGTLDWGAQTANLSVPTTATPVFVITSSTATWTPETVEGYWTAYSETGVYNDTQGGASYTYYLTGSFNQWSLGDALAMDGDSVQITLQAGTYSFKVLTGNVTWDGAMGYNSLNPSCSSDGPITTDDDQNIVVTLTDAGIISFRVEQSAVCVRLYPVGGNTSGEPILANIMGVDYLLTGAPAWTAEVAAQNVESFDRSTLSIPSTVTYQDQTYTVTAIADYAFYQISVLTSVGLPSTLTRIGTEAFSHCTNLSSVTLPDGMIEVGESAFDQTALTTPLYNDLVFMYMPTTYIGSYTVPGDIQLIANSAFYNCQSLSEIIIPSSVTTLGISAFAQCTGLTEVTLPPYVTSIGSAAFDGCSNMSSVNIPDGVTKIENYTFRDCSSLSSVIVPSAVDSIGDESFGSCSGLQSFTCMASTPPVLNEYAFYGLPSIDNVAFYVPAPSLSAYRSAPVWQNITNIQGFEPTCPYSGTCGVDGNNVLWTLSCDSVLTISGTGAMADYMGSSYVPWSNYSNVIREAVVGSGVTSLSEYSTFENCTALESVILPEGITSLGGYTFSNCTSLKGIDLPSTLTSLGSYCFGDCNAIDSIVSRAMTPPTANGSTFSFAGETVAVYVPEAAMSSYQSADGWSNFSDFRALVLPPLASGYCGAEGDSTNLAWVLGADSVLTITGTGAMADYFSFTNVPWYTYINAIASIIVSEGVTTIGSYAFMKMENLRSASLPEGLTRLGQSAFYLSSGLQEVNFPSTITQLENGVFNNTSITTPLYNEHIFAFMPPSYEGAYTIPDGVEQIAGYAFESCSGVTSVTIPQSVNSIGGSAFGYCTSLESVNIPDGITYIEGYTFTNCTSLNSIEIPASVTRIANMAFNGCTSLGNIYCRGAYPPEDNLLNAFTNIDTSIVTVFVPSRSISLYKTAEGWKKFSNIRGQDDPNRFTMPISTEWQFIMLPSVTGAQSCGLSVDSIVCDSTLTWARYLGSYRAQGKSGWVLFNPADNEGEFLCSSAYIVRANGPGATLTMKVAANAANMSSETHTYEKHQARHAENANWNFVGNPYPYYYNILAQLNAMGVTTPITIWNGTGYEIFTPGIDTERMLAPFEAFFIQVPDDMESLVVEFSGEYIIM